MVRVTVKLATKMSKEEDMKSQMHSKCVACNTQ